MNAVVETVNTAGRAFVEFALPMLIQSSVLILILLMVDAVLRRRVRAVFRYWIWMLVLVKLVLPPSLGSPVSVGTWFGATLHIPTERVAGVPPARAEGLRPSVFEGGTPSTPAGKMPATQQPPIPEPAISRLTSEIPAAVEHPVAPETGTIAHPPAPALTWQGLALLIWSVVVIALTLLLLQRALFVRGLAGQAQDANGTILAELEACRRRLGLRGRVGLCFSPNAASPAVCGLVRPVILIPQTLAPRLHSHDLQAVLLHELAHIKRGDLWTNLVQTLLQIAYFYNPLLWLANAMIRRTREQAVDETVLVAMGETARRYPETLVNIARLAFIRRPTLSLRLIGVVESKSALAARIKHILNHPLPKTARVGVFGVSLIMVVAVVLLPMAKAKPLAGPGRDVASPAEDQRQNSGESFVSSDLVANLPNGAVVKFLGIRDCGSKEELWWRPNGAILPGAPHRRFASGRGNQQENTSYQAVFRIGSSAGKTFAKMEWTDGGFPTPAHLHGPGGGLRHSSDIPPDAVNLFDTILLPRPGTSQGRIDIGVGLDNAWEPLGMLDGRAPNTAARVRDAVIDPAREERGKTSVTVSHRITDREIRLVAVDQNGLVRTPEQEGGNIGVGTYRATFGLPLAEIQLIRLETQKLSWVAFTNVSLRPGEKTEVQIETGSNGLADAATREVALPEADRRPVILDLATGELVPLPPTGPEPAKAQQALRELGKGDILYDVDLGDRTFLLLRDAKSEQAREDTGEPGIPGYYIGPNLPQTLTVTTAEGRRYEVTILAADEKACTLKYSPIPLDRGAGGGVPVEPVESPTAAFAARLPNGVTVELLAYSQLDQTGLRWWTPAGERTTIPGIYEADVEGHGVLLALRIEPEPEYALAWSYQPPDIRRELKIWRMNGSNTWLAALGQERNYVNVEVYARLKDPPAVQSVSVREKDVDGQVRIGAYGSQKIIDLTAVDSDRVQFMVTSMTDGPRVVAALDVSGGLHPVRLVPPVPLPQDPRAPKGQRYEATVSLKDLAGIVIEGVAARGGSVKFRNLLLAGGERGQVHTEITPGEEKPMWYASEFSAELTKLGAALSAYADSHAGRYPADLAELGSSLGESGREFVKQHVTYLAAGRTMTASPNTPLAYGTTLLPFGFGTYVLYSNGRVDFEAPAKLKELGIADASSEMPSPSRASKAGLFRVHGVVTDAAGRPMPGESDAAILSQPNRTLTLGWNGQRIVLPGPLVYPRWIEETAEYGQWRKTRGMQTFRGRAPDGSALEAICAGATPDSNGNSMALILAARRYRSDGSLENETSFSGGPETNIKGWTVYEADGVSFRVEERDDDESRIFWHGRDRKPIKEWRVSPHNVVYAELHGDQSFSHSIHELRNARYDPTREYHDQRFYTAPPETQLESRYLIAAPSEQTGLFRVHGVVTDTSGRPMAGVEVVVDCGFEKPKRADRALTDENGRYSLDFKPAMVVADADPYGVGIQPAFVQARKVGFYETSLRHKGNLAVAGKRPGPDEQRFIAGRAGVVLPHEPYELNFTMAPAARIEGSLVDAQDRPLPGKMVALLSRRMYPSNVGFEMVRTDDDGRFTVENVPCTAFQFTCLNNPLGQSAEMDITRPGVWRQTLKYRQTGEHTAELKAIDLQGPAAGPAPIAVAPSGGPGPLGRYALSFDGVDDCLVVPPSLSMNLKPPFSIEVWARPDFSDVEPVYEMNADTAKKYWPYLSLVRQGNKVEKGEGLQDGGFQVFIAPARGEQETCRASLYDAAGEGRMAQRGLVTVHGLDGHAGWFHFPVDFTKPYHPPAPDTPLVVGENILETPQGFAFKGQIAEIRLWNKALTEAESQRYRATRLTGNEPNLVACWTFDEGSGQIAHDISPNANHARLGRVVGADDADPTWIGLGALQDVPGKISGRVLDPNGKPAAGVQVALFTARRSVAIDGDGPLPSQFAGSERAPTVRTDAQGWFRFEGEHDDASATLLADRGGFEEVGIVRLSEFLKTREIRLQRQNLGNRTRDAILARWLDAERLSDALPGIRAEAAAVSASTVKQGISGTVVDPNGKPVARAQVALCTQDKGVIIEAGWLVPTTWGGKTSEIVETDAQGRFSFPTRPDEFHLVAAHEKGFVWRTDQELVASDDLRLEPWGRVEGTLKIGREVGADERVNLFENARKGAIGQNVRYDYQTQTDSAGRFVFERVPPSWMEVGYMIRVGGPAHSYTSRTPIRLEPGQNLKMTLGGEGRPVIGRFVPPADYKEPVYFGAGLRAFATSRPELPQPGNHERMTRREQAEWRKEWLKTPEARAFYDAIWHDLNRRHYAFRINDDGSFRIEDVIPGRYDFTVWLEERFNNEGPGEFGSYHGTVEVPPMAEAYSDKPLDVGDLVLKIRPPLHVGDTAPLFEARTLDGKDIRLADYRGRFVLLVFWSPVFHPELDRLKELHATYGGTGKLQIIGLGGTDTLDEVRKYVEEHRIEWPEIYFGPDWDAELLKQLGGQMQIMLIDPAGKIVATWLRDEKLSNTVRDALEADAQSPEP